MFPWSPEFKWDAGHLAFFGALYAVLATVAGSLMLAAWRALRDTRDGRTAAIVWHGEFEDMPASARACRHQLTGEAPGRACDNGFDCRHCAGHPHFEGLRRVVSEDRSHRPLRLRPAPGPPLPSRAHLGAAGEGRHPHRRPRRPRPPPRRHARAGGVSRGRQPAAGERPRGPDHHAGQRRAAAVARGRHGRPGARRGRLDDAARRSRRCRRPAAPALRGRGPRLGAARSWSGCSGPSARASSARPSPTAASWSRTWEPPCRATATTLSSARCCWSRRGAAASSDPRGSAGGREPREPSLRRIDSREVAAHVVVAAPLAGGQSEPPPGVGVSRSLAAQVDHGGEILLLPQGRGGDPPALQRARDLAIQEGGGHLDRVGRHDARVGAVPPARRPCRTRARAPPRHGRGCSSASPRGTSRR